MGTRAAGNNGWRRRHNLSLIHIFGVDLVRSCPLAMFATDPALFGRSGEIALGKKSGKASVQYYLERCGMTATDEQAAEMLARVKARGLEKRGLLDEAEFREIAAACLGA